MCFICTSTKYLHTSSKGKLDWCTIRHFFGILICLFPFNVKWVSHLVYWTARERQSPVYKLLEAPVQVSPGWSLFWCFLLLTFMFASVILIFDIWSLFWCLAFCDDHLGLTQLAQCTVAAGGRQQLMAILSDKYKYWHIGTNTITNIDTLGQIKIQILTHLDKYKYKQST